MDMHSLIHPSAENMRAAAFPSAAAQGAALPGLRAHFQTLPFRLPTFPSASPSDHNTLQDLRHPSPPPSHQQQQPQQPSLSPSAATTSQPATATLAPLRFIIPCASSSSVAPPYSGSASRDAGGYSSVTAGMAEPEAELEPSRTYTQATIAASDLQSLQTATAGQLTADETTVEREPAPLDSDALKSKKATVKRVRAVKNVNRSTKSKARPGLRKGKWTDEESAYATQLTHYFKEGLLPIDRGTMLRLYLSQKLNCEPMRITKKFTGVECIGKQVFRPCHATPEARVRMMQAQLELVALEAAFIKKLRENREDVPGSADDHGAAESQTRVGGGSSTDNDDGFTSDSSNSSLAAYARVGAMLKKPTALVGAKEADDEDVDSANAVGLLLDFFHKANRNETKRANADAVASTERSDSGANSPTKRIRALSISSYVPDDSLTKRSRLDAAPAVFAK